MKILRSHFSLTSTCIFATLMSSPALAIDFWHSSTVYANQGECSATFTFDSGLEDIKDLQIGVHAVNRSGTIVDSGILAIKHFGHTAANRYDIAYLEGESVCADDLTIIVIKASAIMNGKHTDLLKSKMIKAREFKPFAIKIRGVADGSGVENKVTSPKMDMLGKDADYNEANMVDVILNGAGGSLKKGERGDHGAGGDGDRLTGNGGTGLGTGGRAGFGTGNGGTRQGKMALGAGGTGGGASRARITAPKPSDVEISGDVNSRSPESILRVIRSNIGGFQYTYQKYLRDNPSLEGQIALKFTIIPSGDINEINIVSSNTGNGALDDEIVDKARRMKFDTIEYGYVTVIYTFLLGKQ